MERSLKMAGIGAKMTIENELRPCIVKDRKALFHKWSDKSNIVDTSTMAGGHSSGVVKYTVGIIEYEDGVVTECYPYEIRFLDRRCKEYCFED
ncbi:hypothetical protein [Anaerosolibacter sp.]|uniref:hypothetical protein n=1 Tax=Anaerosolibacter sp. TaxID=1872527 RepID=UPI0039EE1A3D